MGVAATYWLELALVLAASGVFLVGGYAVCRRWKRVKTAVILLGSACVGVRILTSALPDQFYVGAPYVIVAGVLTPAGFLLLAAGLAEGVWGSRKRVLVGVFSVVLTYYVFCDVAFLAAAGPEVAGLSGRWQGGALRQSRRYTCGPAAAAALLRAWGIDVEEGEAAFAARTSFRGTELPRLAEAVEALGRAKGLEVDIRRMTRRELEKFNRPAVLLVERNGTRHAVAVLRLSGARMLIADPGAGMREFRAGDFARFYSWSGRAIVAWRNPKAPRPASEPPEPTLHD